MILSEEDVEMCEDWEDSQYHQMYVGKENIPSKALDSNGFVHGGGTV